MDIITHHVLHLNGLIHGEGGLLQGSGQLTELRQKLGLILLVILQLLRGMVLSVMGEDSNQSM